ncbi:MAG TPA: TaqI-like C-terminal specificity domain-containing protein [Phycisphaerae bacterium]|nr:TaqI-like C-terminal specificity domain-containing protein [Phycisphaerae bacterium]
MSTQDALPESVLRLIARFDEHRDAYHNSRYNETQLRREFLDPLFQALGWDVDNAQGWAEAYKDVIHEDAIDVGGATKAPDYCFRIGGVRKFFLEAKKPSVDIKGDPGPAYQLRRYAWSAKLPLSILSDFEEFAAYDCRIKPDPHDKASAARVMLLRYTDYADPARWNEIASIFSREAILRGSFDKYAESTRRKKGTAEVDDAFLAEIEQWRDMLARNIALRNPNLSQRELNFAVQKTIDRIIFLRICEDRGIEPGETLRALTAGPKIYPRLFERFRRADERYNSGLFFFTKEKGRAEPPDELTPALAIDDKVLKDIIGRLYYPDSPYEFSVLPADILGQVYEQFLGKVIRLTAGHQARVEEKPEVRKAGGVYYTPAYIVEYIVRHTVGRLLWGYSAKADGTCLAYGQGPTGTRGRGQEAGIGEKGAGKYATSSPIPGPCSSTPSPSSSSPSPAPRSLTPKQASRLRILDPACGSGSFLLGAYQFLIDWYRDWYVNDGPEKHTAGREPRLYQHSSGQWRLTTPERKRILVSHIFGVDIDSQAVEVTKLSLLLKVLEGESQQSIDNQLRLFHERALPDLGSNIKCGNSLIGPDFYDGKQPSLFDEDEVLRINAFDWHAEFPHIMTAGGFDAVIGNPPYLSFSGRQAVDISDDERRYYERRYSSGGWPTSHGLFIERAVRTISSRMVSYIVPDQVGHLNGYQVVRDVIAEHSALVQIRYWGERVFTGVVTPALTFVADKDFSGPGTVLLTDGTACELLLGAGIKWTARSHDDLLAKAHRVGRSLGQMVADPGVHTGNCSEALILPLSGSENPLVPVLEGKQISRYRCDPPTKGLDLRYRPRQGEYFTIRPEDRYSRACFVIRQTAAYPIIGPRGHTTTYFRNSLLALYPPQEPLDVRFFVGLLNSRLIRHLYTATVHESEQKAFPQVKVRALRELPIYWPDVNQPKDRARHDRMVSLVQSMLDLHKRLAAAGTDHEKTALNRQIDATDRQIDELVYELYGLSDGEIKIVEEATK